MNWIDHYDLFIFDFDGTIIDNEPIHYQCYYKTIEEHLEDKYKDRLSDFTYEKYQLYAHSLDLKEFEYYLKYFFNLSNYHDLYIIKQHKYIEYIENNQLNYCPGIEEFLQLLINKNKEFVIVTNSSKKSIDKYLLNPTFTLLNYTKEFITKENLLHKKPHPECYLKVCQKYPQLKKIGFEDSLRGYHSLYQLSNYLTPVFINSSFYFERFILNNYQNPNYGTSILNIEFDNNLELNNFNKINNMITHSIDQIETNRERIKDIVDQISLIIKNKNKNNNIYLTGMGKSGYICKKSASTWQSLSLPGIYLDLPNLPHGDFGILKDNDIIIFISNSGNTSELIYIVNYLKNHFHKKIMLISITANENNKIQEYCDFSFYINPIIEADHLNMTPSTSSFLFMMILDFIGLNIRDDITKNEFKMNHPAGSLGLK